MFQTTIINKYLKAHTDINANLEQLYNKYTAYFHNHEIQDNIRSSKEEQFQEGFLRELFVEILGYIINPNPNYNLITEQKNTQDSKKADGAIIVNNQVVAVIELKDRKTPNLKDIDAQAFNYKASHKECRYVITSNFEKLRFYIDNLTEHLEFNLFTLTKDQFAQLHLLLSYSSIQQNLPLRIKQESLSREDTITNKLYKDYTQFKRELFADLVQNNTQYDKLTLFKKSQKLLDRLLFIFFAEDKGLLPPNTIINHISGWQNLMSDPLNPRQKLYDRFKAYFQMLNTGNKELGIYAYNGGLFAPDSILDTVLISDNILQVHTNKLSTYDFATEVDVNILGHIFENSLNEIDEVTTEITTGEKPVSKRKKDGVFYTPRYITKYIVDNTIGRLCNQKRTELNITEQEYTTDKRRQKKTIVALAENLKEYRQWLLSLTICDPACGSGAFLNAALDFLIAEHRQIDEFNAALYGGGLVFPDIENSILENNLFGVDINDESVEIARLSLWLRTARPQRKLNSLSNNIKCGNSLIADPNIAGSKAFNWHTEFPQVFERGGFDVVIGNPPYVQLQARGGALATELENCGYETFTRMGDLYCLFYELGIQILRNNGIEGFITSNKWMRAGYGERTREFFIKYNPLYIIEMGAGIFESATVDSNILIIEKSNNKQSLQGANFNSGDLDFSMLKFGEINVEGSDIWTILSPIEQSIKEKIKTVGTPLKEWDVEIYRGILTGYNDAFIISTEVRNNILANCSTDEERKRTEELIKPILRGRDIMRFSTPKSEQWIIGTYPSLGLDIDNFESLKSYLFSFGDRIKQTGEKGCRKKTNNKWYETQDTIAYYQELLKEKIVWKRIGSILRFSYDTSGCAVLDSTCFAVGENIKFLVGFLNSKMGNYLLQDAPKTGTGDLLISVQALEPIYIPKISIDSQPDFIKLIDEMTEYTKNLTTKRQKFLKRLSDNFEGIKITTALDSFYQMEFKDFVAQLKKQKFDLTLLQQDEWEEYFTAYLTECTTLRHTIATTDAQIDRMVYELYNLTEEEIKVIENR